MTPVHNLLKRQLKRYLAYTDVPGEWSSFVNAVNNAYWEFDSDRGMLERALELSSQELLQANSEMRAVLQTFPDLLLWVGADGVVHQYKAGNIPDINIDIKTLPGRSIYDCGLPGMGDNFRKAIQTVQLSRKPLTIEFPLDIAGTPRSYEARLLPVLQDLVFIIIRDITERKRMEEQLRFLSMNDSLTGLYNRTCFSREINYLDEFPFQPTGFILCDVDGLKLVNDTLGHEAGDRLLINTAEILSQSVPDCNLLARIGGDEFAIIYHSCNRLLLEDICQNIRKRIAAYNQNNINLPLSVSIGVSLRGDDHLRIIDLYKEADNNMYREKLHHRQSIRNNTIKIMAKALGERDFITQGHGQRMQFLVTMMANALGIPRQKQSDLILLAQFHDIGKVGITDGILFKEDKLDAAERNEMRRHPEIGFRIAEASSDLMPISQWILKHHEWWNGKGYPLGLEGEQIPLECRILALADAYDAMTSDRPYRKAMDPDDAINEILNGSGSQFDPDLIPVFIEAIKNM
ncbi:MAG: HD domain-containing phosphohydrolase [Deltaproteobacteria bacterium]